ncbi:MAG: LysR family transcriptional regulator [Verrucomicrobiota bacterium]
MDLKRLKYFVTAAEELNMSRAARTLNVSQPALSRSIKELEAEVGAELFHRSSSGVSLTKAGEELLQSADEILLTWEQSMVSLRNMSTGREAALEVAYAPVALEAFMGPAMAILNQTHPNLTIHPNEINSHQQVDALRDGEGDVCIIAHRTDEDLEEDFDVFHICEMKMSAVVSERDEFASRDSIRLEELAEREFVAYDPKSQRYCEAMVRGLFDVEGVPYRPSMYANSCQSMVAAICSGRGFGILPMLGSLIVSEHFEFIELESDKAVLKTAISALVRKGENRKSVLAFLQECRRIALMSVPRREKEYQEKRELRREFLAGKKELSSASA